MSSQEKGRLYVTVIAVYMVVKSVINLLLGFSVTNIIMLVVSAVLGYGLRSRRNSFELITAVFLIAVALLHLKDNINGRQWLYLAEGAADILCGAALLLNKDIKNR